VSTACQLVNAAYLDDSFAVELNDIQTPDMNAFGIHINIVPDTSLFRHYVTSNHEQPWTVSTRNNELFYARKSSFKDSVSPLD
jgi:hypothetical protein